jgi:hypothetical protein
MNTMSNPFSELAALLAPSFVAVVRLFRRVGGACSRFVPQLPAMEEALASLGHGELACEAFARRPRMRGLCG